ncbi:MAG: alpha/beta hydrolase [Burkholderiales bacterium]|nr:alpha/beta hydrolase [Burkholderiales bacterium]
MSLQNFVLSTLMRLAQRASATLSAEHRFRRNRRFLAADRSKPGPAVQIKPDQLAGLPVEWVTPRSLTQPDTAPICLYPHGGAFVMGGLNSHRDLAAQLARRAQIRLLMVDYRLAPEHPFPAALDDALAVYQALLAQGIPALRLLLAGDSAGGNLALGTAQAIQAQGLPPPAALVLFSPWLDLTDRSPSRQANAASDVMLSQQVLDEAAALYAPGMALDDARLSPLFGPLAGLPPCLLVASRAEILIEDTRRLQQQMLAAGGKVELLEWANTPHSFPVMARYLPEGRAALDQAAQFIRQQTVT